MKRRSGAEAISIHDYWGGGGPDGAKEGESEERETSPEARQGTNGGGEPRKGENADRIEQVHRRGRETSLKGDVP